MAEDSLMFFVKSAFTSFHKPPDSPRDSLRISFRLKMWRNKVERKIPNTGRRFLPFLWWIWEFFWEFSIVIQDSRLWNVSTVSSRAFARATLWWSRIIFLLFCFFVLSLLRGGKILKCSIRIAMLSVPLRIGLIFFGKSHLSLDYIRGRISHETSVILTRNIFVGH